MGLNTTILLGWKGKDILSKAKALKIFLNTDNEWAFYDFDATDVNKKLIPIQRYIFKDVLNFEIIEEIEDEGHYFFNVKTPFGEEHFSAMSMKAAGEFYEDELTDISFGIRLNGDFSPVLIDYDGDRGASFSITKEKFELVEKLKSEVVKVYPCFSDAQWRVEVNWV
jgi:hypothetical protein